MNQGQKIVAQFVALLVVAGALGGYAYFGVYKKDQDKARQQEHDLRLFAPQKLDEKQADGGSPPAEFTTLIVVAGEERTELERRGRDWWIVKPLEARADKLAIDGITSQLQSAKFKATLEESPDAATLAKYGLDRPRFSVEATATVNGETRAVKLVGGIENTFDGSVYVRRNDEKPVYLAEGGVRYTLSKSTFELRDKHPLALDEAKIQRIALQSVNNDYVLERAGDKAWNLVKPNAEPADATVVSAMIAGVSQERAVRFPPEADARALGFDKPFLAATITLSDGRFVKLRVARQATDAGEQYFAIREDAEGSVLAELGVGATQFDRNPAELRDKAILRFRREAVTKLVFHDPAAGPDVVIEKESADASAEAWRVTAPKQGKAKVFKVTGALWTLGSFKALFSGEEKPKDWAKYGLDGKGRSITLFGEDGKELARLQIGKEVGPDKPNVFYVRGSRDQVFESDGSRFGELPFTLGAVLDEPDAGTP
ncbi:MAG: DUF4340 domain-containing protein [Myxococcota bacterium]